MRRITALLLAIILLLTACGSGTSAPTDTPTVRAETNGWDITFHLDGYQGRTRPLLTATGLSGQTWAGGAQATVNRAGASYRLNLWDEKHIPADVITYTWETPDGERLSGEVIYVSPSANLPWQVTRTDQFILFHAAPLEEGEAEAYEAAYGRLVEWSGQRMESQTVVYLFPDHESLLGFYEVMGGRPPVVGFATKGRMYVRGGWPVAEKARVITHEMVHLLGAYSSTLWVAEGLAEYFSLKEMRLQAEAGAESVRREMFREQFGTLHQLAQDGWLVNLGEVPQLEPPGQDAYTVGVAFMLFLRSREGEDGVRRLLAVLREGGVRSWDAVEEVMGAEIGVLEREFQEYLRSGRMLEDVRGVFGL